MNTTHKPWGRLEQSRYSSRKDFGGVLSGIGGIAGAAGSIPSPAAPFLKIGGAALGMIGNLVSGNKQKKEAEKAQAQALMQQKQAQLLAMPTAQGGIQGGTMNPLNAQFGGYLNAKSGIYIKPENKGKFTETKKRTGKTTEELTHSKNPLTRKRAIFAQNAAEWKHELGGPMERGGYINPLQNNNLLEFKTGGTHNQNPLGGIPMGYDKKGIMNTVEQGESAHKFKKGKYVFSNKIKIK